MGFCTEVVCDGCADVIHRNRILSKGLITRIARKEGWSIGKYTLCPKCKKNRAKLKKDGWLN